MKWIGIPAAIVACLLVASCWFDGGEGDRRHNHHSGYEPGPYYDGNDDAEDDTGDGDDLDDDADDTTRNDLDWVAIPSGVFQMGCSPTDALCDPEESPRHEVALDSFYLTATEITQRQYEDVTASNPGYHASCPHCPAEVVEWTEADAFCTAVGGRLPTEAEWEYAARAGSDAAYVCGPEPTCLEVTSWYRDDSGDSSHPVAEKAPNDFGLYDMLGNVEEWVSDWYDADYYTQSPRENPRGWSTGRMRVVRGGGWNQYSAYLRVSYRNRQAPDYSTTNLGFRCARGGE
jgi:formylglycine-generating enzyme